MPELPEVETIVRTLAPQIQGKYIRNIETLLPRSLAAGAELVPAITGAKITSVKRRAKLLLVFLSKDMPKSQTEQYIMAFHLKMTGRFFVHPKNTEPLKHTRIIFDLAEQEHATQTTERLFFDDIRTFGYCRIMRPEDLANWGFWQKLGLEPLENSSQALAQALHSHNKIIKGALLDQTIIAGIGNIYADEALFYAGLHPKSKAINIPLAKLEELGAGVQKILQKSIEECGSSIRDYRDANGDAGSFQNSFAVYGRKGQACKVCQSILEGANVAGRGTTFCPKCQKEMLTHTR